MSVSANRRNALGWRYPFCTPAWHPQNSVKLACRRDTLDQIAPAQWVRGWGPDRSPGPGSGDDSLPVRHSTVGEAVAVGGDLEGPAPGRQWQAV